MITIHRADLVLIQDRGRHTFMDQGVPVSGAWDLHAYDQVTELVGGSAVFEILAGGFAAQVDQATTVAAVGEFTTGTMAHSFAVPAGGAISLTVTRGPAYLAVAGLQVEATLGSAATDLVSGFGPARVAPGDTFPAGGVRPNAQLRAAAPSRSTIGYLGQPMPGRWRVVTHARSGTRITCTDGWDQPTPPGTPSRPVVPGTIQWVSASEAIILGPDSGVTGGYPVVGVVATADLPRVAHLNVDQEFTLESISLAEAIRRARVAREWSVLRLP